MVIGVELGAKDLIALAIIVCATILVGLGRIGVDQFMYVLLLVAGYYFGYAHGVMKREQK
jgi:hypothetical protein